MPLTHPNFPLKTVSGACNVTAKYIVDFCKNSEWNFSSGLASAGHKTSITFSDSSV